MMRRILNLALTLFAALVCVGQPAAQALSPEQVRVMDSGIYYFNTDDSCSGSSAAATDSSTNSGSLDLAAVSKKYAIGWAEIKKLNGPVVDEYNSADQLPAVASILKLVIADAFLSDQPNLDKTVTITSSELYGGPGTGKDDPSDPKAGYRITLRESLKQMLMNSSNTNANTIIDAAGGSKAITARAKQLGYKDTTIDGYHARGGGDNSSTVADLTDAMDKVYTASGEGYQIAQTALRNENVKWGLDSEANKWAGVSNATGNTAVFNIDSTKYIVTMYDSLNGEQGKDTPGAQPIQDATNAVLSSLRGLASTPTSSTGPSTTTSGSCTCSADQTGSVYKFVQTLAYKESGGDPTAKSKTSDASGKYQYMPLTWQDSAKNHYGPARQYSVANQAPEAIQDAVAYIEYSVKSVEFKGDLTKMAVSHYYPVANSDPSKMDVVPQGNTETPRQYAQNFLSDLNAGKGQDDPLKFISAPDFATWYAKSVGHPYAPGDDQTGSSGGGSCNSSPAGSFVFYDQNDPKWSGHPYGSSTIADSGCGPTSVAMVVATLADSSVTPIETADFGTKNGAYIPNQGSDHQKMLVLGPEHWGLSVSPLGTDLSRAANVLRQGGLVIATGPKGSLSPFSKEGHIIVLRSVTKDGKFLIGNPAPSLQKSQDQEFSAQDLLSAGLQALYGVTK